MYIPPIAPVPVARITTLASDVESFFGFSLFFHSPWCHLLLLCWGHSHQKLFEAASSCKNRQKLRTSFWSLPISSGFWALASKSGPFKWCAWPSGTRWTPKISVSLVPSSGVEALIGCIWRYHKQLRISYWLRGHSISPVPWGSVGLWPVQTVTMSKHWRSSRAQPRWTPSKGCLRWSFHIWNWLVLLRAPTIKKVIISLGSKSWQGNHSNFQENLQPGIINQLMNLYIYIYTVKGRKMMKHDSPRWCCQNGYTIHVLDARSRPSVVFRKWLLLSCPPAAEGFWMDSEGVAEAWMQSSEI